MVNDIDAIAQALATMLAGASAPLTGVTGLSSNSGVLWHDTANNQIKLRDQADTTWIVIGTVDEVNKIFTAAGGGGGGGTVTGTGSGVPSGRLSGSSSLPVQVADVLNVSSVYYVPYVGNTIPIYNGTSFSSLAFSTQTLTLTTANNLAGSVYDVFACLQGGTPVIGTGPAWSINSSYRGVGGGTTQLTQVGGLWVNANIITLRNGSTSYTNVAVNQATYLGSVYCTQNGATTMQVSANYALGGGNLCMGIYNAYNRVRTVAACSDTTPTWTYASNAWRPTDGNANNKIAWLDGLQQSSFEACTASTGFGSAVGCGLVVGVGIDSGTAPTGLCGNFYSAGGGTAYTGTAYGLAISPPLLGIHYIQSLENVTGGTMTMYGGGPFGGSGQNQYLKIDIHL